MLNNLTNFFNLITGRMIKKVPENTDLIVLGTKHPRYGGGYAPTGITYDDLKADILADVPTSDCCPVLDVEGNLIIANNSTNTVAVGPGGTQFIPEFSGFLLVNDHYDGGVETWIAGGGDTICLGATNTGGGPVGSSLTISGTGYLWTNDSNMTGPFTFTVIKTRAEA